MDKGNIYKITPNELYSIDWENTKPQVAGQNNHQVHDVNFNNLNIDKQAWQDSSAREKLAIKLLKPFKARTRFYILVLVLLCLASIWSNILAFNFAVICIPSPNKNNSGGHHNQETQGIEINDDDEGIFSISQTNYLTMSTAIGALIANFPAVFLVNRFGIRTILPIFGLISAISTALIPLAIMNGFLMTIIARFVQGIAFACNFPAIGMFTSKWTYFKQNGLFVSTLVAFVQLSPTLTNPISGVLCESSLGWQSVFYGHAMVSLILFVLFFFLYRNTPAKHPLVHRSESEKIAIGKSANLKEASKNIPYLHILKTVPIWAIWIAALGNFYCVNLVFLYQATYLKKVLGFGVGETGLSAAFPSLLQFGFKLMSGFISDKIHCISETAKLKVFNTVAFCGAALLLVILGFIPAKISTACFLILVFAEGCLGIATGGFFKNGSIISKHYNSFVTGNISLGIMISMLIVPLMVNGINKHNEQSEWRWIFIITACVLVGANIIYVLLSSGEPAYWTTDEFQKQYMSKQLKNAEIGIQTNEIMEKGVEINGIRYQYNLKNDDWEEISSKMSRNDSVKDSRKSSCIF